MHTVASTPEGSRKSAWKRQAIRAERWFELLDPLQCFNSEFRGGMLYRNFSFAFDAWDSSDADLQDGHDWGNAEMTFICRSRMKSGFA
jgi:hypothetical protein